ncbi:MAG: tetratricopeptide repeat protein [Candidatus Melainabacteria bacterium]|nr:tetratricopeptide repeat protein [Candidatus Melainabacteria bacterium]
MQIHRPTLKLIALIALTTFALPPSSATTSYMNRGIELYNSGNYGKAKEAFIEIVCANPHYWPAHYQLANTYFKLNDKTAAQFEYEWCLKFCKDKRIRRKMRGSHRYYHQQPGHGTFPCFIDQGPGASGQGVEQDRAGSAERSPSGSQTRKRSDPG